MSKVSKGRMGWMSVGGIADKPATRHCVTSVQQGAFDQPVYVFPLDPDGPLPGQLRMWDKDTIVQVIEPWSVRNGSVIWKVRRHDDARVLHVDGLYLRPIPETRRVTVELTEAEEDFLRRVPQMLHSEHAKSLATKILAELDFEAEE